MPLEEGTSASQDWGLTLGPLHWHYCCFFGGLMVHDQDNLRKLLFVKEFTAFTKQCTVHLTELWECSISEHNGSQLLLSFYCIIYTKQQKAAQGTPQFKRVHVLNNMGIPSTGS